MAYEHVTITFTGEMSVEFSYEPSDVLTAGIYPDATVLMIDRDGAFIDGEHIFYILDNQYGSHTASYANYTAVSGVQFALQTAFGSEAQAGRYLYNGFPYNEENSIPIVARTTNAGEPSSPTLEKTVSREAVELSWGAGSAGTNNPVTGYDVQYQDSADGSTWPSSWTTASGSPVMATKLSVSPPATVGYYRRFRVRTRGSAGSDYYSSWVVSTNTLRRKWNAFGAWTDPTLTARSSMIRAVYLTEIQQRVNVIRAFYGLATYSFTAVTARSTKIARWASLIQEIRTAIDGVTTTHESWNTLEAGKPRIAHITQLRNIIDSL